MSQDSFPRHSPLNGHIQSINHKSARHLGPPWLSLQPYLGARYSWGVSLFGVVEKDRNKLLSRPWCHGTRHQALPCPARATGDYFDNRHKTLETTKPTAAKAIASLVEAEILRETTGRKRDRVMPISATCGC